MMSRMKRVLTLTLSMLLLFTAALSMPLLGQEGGLPLRDVFESIGANVFWDAENGHVVVQHQQLELVFVHNESNALINGESFALQYPITLVNNQTMISYADASFLLSNFAGSAWLTVEERVFGLSVIWRGVSDMSPFISTAPEGFDWDALFLEYIPQVVAAADMVEYYEVLSRFLAHLGDGKSNIQSPASPYINPMLVDYVDGSFVVTGISPERVDIPLGSVVLSVNGVDTGTFLEENFGALDGRRAPLVRESILATNFTIGSRPISMTLEILPTGQSEVIHETISFAPLSEELMTEVAMAQSHALDVRNFWDVESMTLLAQGATAFALDNNIHHITIETFLNPVLPEAVRQYIEDVADTAQAFIFDLRGNGGGTSDMVILGQFAEMDDLIANSARSYRQMRDGALMGVANSVVASRALGVELPDEIWGLVVDGRSLHQGLDMLNSTHLEPMLEFEIEGVGMDSWDIGLIAEQSLRLFDIPVVILVDHYSASASESFASAAMGVNNFTIMGTNTAGMAGDISPFLLPGGGLLSLNVVKQLTHDGQVINNHGIMPDVWVAQSLSDLLNGIDTQLTAAVEYLADRISQ